MKKQQDVELPTREIKFRVWDKVNKVMIFDDNMYISMLGYVGIETPYDGIDCSKSENFVLMQYIGWKDKIGQEIYEGDFLINNYYTHFPFYIVRYKKMTNCGCNGIDSGIGFDLQSDDPTEFTVFGNIYENPEREGKVWNELSN